MAKRKKVIRRKTKPMPRRRKKVIAVRPRRKKSGNPNYHIKLAKREILKKIGDKHAKKIVAKTKRAKRKITKEISVLTRQFRKL